MAELNIADDANSWPAIEASIISLASGYGRIIDEVLHGRGAEEIQKRIDQLLPTSGRRWKGKPPQAKGAKWQHYTNESLAVTVGTTARYHYLYFPDDGSNTRTLMSVINKCFYVVQKLRHLMLLKCLKRHS